MSDFYRDMQNIATGLLKEFDQSTDETDGLWYVAVTSGNGPPDDPGEPVETPYKLQGAARGVSFEFVDGSTIVAADFQLTCAVDERFTPGMPGFVLQNGARYKIKGIRPLPPSGVTVANIIIFGK